MKFDNSESRSNEYQIFWRIVMQNQVIQTVTMDIQDTAAGDRIVLLKGIK